MYMLRSKLFQTNDQCRCMAVLCFLQITQISVYSTQAIVRSCNIYMVKSELLHINARA